MKHIFHLTFALLAGMALCACSSDDPMDNDQTPVPVQPGETGSDDTWGVKIEGDMTRGLSPSNPTSTLTPNFNGETIYVYYGSTNVGTLKAPSGNLTGDRTPTGRLNNASYTVGQNLSLYFLKDKGFSTYTGQKGTIADIAANFDYATATAQITGVDVNTHTLTISKATFTSQQAIIGFKFSIGLNSGDLITIKQNNASGTTKATVTSPAVTANSTIVYVALPLTASDTQYTYYFDITRSGNAYCKGTLALDADHKMRNGKYYSAQTVTLYKHMNYAINRTVSSNKITAWNDVRSIIAKDGYIYPNEATAKAFGGSSNVLTGVIVYVGTTGNTTYNHGIAIYKGLDEGGSDHNYSWAESQVTNKNKTKPIDNSNISWRMPSIDDWKKITYSLKLLTLSTTSQALTNVSIGDNGSALNRMYWSSSKSGEKRQCYRANTNGNIVNQSEDNVGNDKVYLRSIYYF